MEYDQGELQRALAEDLAYRPWTGLKEHIEAYLKTAVCRLNHMRRRRLGGNNACRVFFDRKGGVRLNKRERKSDSRLDKATGSTYNRGNQRDTSKRAINAAWRIACEAWLQIRGFITVTVNGKVLPYFLPKMDHN